MIDPKNRKTVNLNFKKVEKFEIGFITGTRFRKQIAKLLNDTIIVYGQRPKDLIITWVVVLLDIYFIYFIYF